MSEKTKTATLEKRQTLFDDLIAVSKWETRFATPSTLAIRQMIFHNRNGFRKKVIVPIENRLYIRISAFEAWVLENKSKQIVAS